MGKRKRPSSNEKKPLEWTIHNDKQSVTVGINTRFWLLRQQNMVPTLIRLGKAHTRLFMKECGLSFIPNRKPQRLIPNTLAWDEENHRLLYKGPVLVPIKFNDPLIHGIAVEGKPRPPKSKKKST